MVAKGAPSIHPKEPLQGPPPKTSGPPPPTKEDDKAQCDDERAARSVQGAEGCCCRRRRRGKVSSTEGAGPRMELLAEAEALRREVEESKAKAAAAEEAVRPEDQAVVNEIEALRKELRKLRGEGADESPKQTPRALQFTSVAVLPDCP